MWRFRHLEVLPGRSVSVYIYEVGCAARFLEGRGGIGRW